MNKTLIVNRSLCREILTIEKCIPYMRNALVAISDKESRVLQRTMIPHKNGNMLALMPASLMSENVTGSKVIIFPGPETAKAGTNQGIIPLFNTETGELLAIIDAELITVVRTAATSAAASTSIRMTTLILLMNQRRRMPLSSPRRPSGPFLRFFGLFSATPGPPSYHFSVSIPAGRPEGARGGTGSARESHAPKVPDTSAEVSAIQPSHL
jgi:hypothetical protein